MPSEKFFEEAPGAPRTVVELAWSSDGEYEGVYLSTYSQTDSSSGAKIIHSVIDLDRDDLNRMIRALRRARNAKYGSDE